MKKILLTIVLLATFCLGSKAATYYYVQGYTPYFDRAWTDRTADRMTNISGTNRYYLIKEWTIEVDETTTYFRIHRSAEGTADGGRQQVYFSYENAYSSVNNIPYANFAPLYFEKAGTYRVFFTIDKADRGTYNFSTQLNESNEFEMNSIQVVIIPISSAPKLSADQGGSSVWEEQNMTYSSEDMKYYLSQEVDVTQDGYVGKFNVNNVYYRTTADGGHKVFGTAGEAGGDNISVVFPDVCHYEMKFTFDPIWRTAPTCTIRGYHDLTIGSYGYSTLSHNMALDVPQGVKAYYVRKNGNGNLMSTPTYNVPKTNTSAQVGTGVIVEGTAGTTHRFYRSANQSTAIPTGNILRGTGSSSYSVADYETYCFTAKDNTVGFYLAVAGDYAPFKAFLPASEVSAAREFIGIHFDSENPLSVDAVREQLVDDSTYYNLQGQPVEHPTKGLYIVGGRKVLVK